ncbi:MAG: MFS transporter [Verrucomicrobia bacterium]|jgi:hypothetical protein|nr:MFS transporter [Verrucomicrobiota bacterium]MBT7068499.1 MFS transporter [Verrucomicrobiota bacterium]MBT7699812.1 MFS transporter [Verrucomicrobiota bacterium]
MNPRSYRHNLVLFLCGAALLGAAGGMYETTFNNFISDTFDLSAGARGFLEFPRELPGFLTALFAGLLFFLAETRIAAVCALMIAGGFFGMAFLGDRWAGMLGFMILWSVGMHLLMPIRSSLSLVLAEKGARGKRLGQIRSVGIGASVVGCGVVYIGMRFFGFDYRVIFVLAGIGALVALVLFARMRMPGAHLARPKFVLRKRYWLYYVLAALFGARKQIFITFGPWVLVRIFDQEAYVLAQLWIAASLIGIFFQPMLGHAIDRFGPRVVLMADAVCIIAVCLGYGFSSRIGNGAALWILYACFVGDQLLFGANMAREIYLAQLAESREHVAPTLSLGISINHAVSMSVPAVGGLIWMRFGHHWVFLGAAGVAMAMLFFSSLIRVPQEA